MPLAWKPHRESGLEDPPVRWRHAKHGQRHSRPRRKSIPVALRGRRKGDELRVMVTLVVLGVDLHHARERPYRLSNGRPFGRKIVFESAHVPEAGSVLENHESKSIGHAAGRSKAPSGGTAS